MRLNPHALACHFWPQPFQGHFLNSCFLEELGNCVGSFEDRVGKRMGRKILKKHHKHPPTSITPI